MLNKERAKETIEKFEWAITKRAIFTFFVVVMMILPVVGYVLERGFVLPTVEDIFSLPISFGAYGFLGICGAAMVVLLICTIIVLVAMIGATGPIMGLILTVIFYLLAESIYISLIEWISLMIQEMSFEVSILGLMISAQQPVPGVSETLGAALLYCLIYDLPFLIFLILCVRSWKSCKKLKGSAQEAQAFLEEEERRAAEEKERQKRARKEQKDRDRRAREAWERHKRHQEWEARQEKSSEEFSFFAGCTTLERLDSRYKGLMRAYHPDTSAGDLEVCQKINAQYQDLKDKFKDEKNNDKKD